MLTVLICLWAQVFPSRPYPCRFLCEHTGIAFQSACASYPVRSLVVCIINTGLKSGQRDGGSDIVAEHKELKGYATYHRAHVKMMSLAI
jgi:hypothetical protein